MAAIDYTQQNWIWTARKLESFLFGRLPGPRVVDVLEVEDVEFLMKFDRVRKWE